MDNPQKLLKRLRQAKHLPWTLTICVVGGLALLVVQYLAARSDRLSIWGLEFKDANVAR